ncbi:OmpH family outer membrane protein [Thalassotalea aquiviva]|uniref:OmpH family outer membrane protein n=1 Tax=Thalassotalea aquiviva TaxID=3242415 RepID=UPI00352AA81E
MNKFIKSIAFTAAAASMLFSGASLAADQKIGIINVQSVFAQMPQAAEIQKTIVAEFKDQAAELQKMEGDINYNMEKRKRDEAILSKKELETLTKEIIAQRQDYETKGRALQQSLKRREAEEQQKLLNEIMTAVQEVAKAEGYDLVLAQQSVAFFKPDADISAKVLEQVNKVK